MKRYRNVTFDGTMGSVDIYLGDFLQNIKINNLNCKKLPWIRGLTEYILRLKRSTIRTKHRKIISSGRQAQIG